MHICFLTHEYPKKGYSHGGVGTFVRILGRALVAAGHKVSVVGVNYVNTSETEVDQGVEIHRVCPSKFRGLKWFFNASAINNKLQEIEKKSHIDVIEATELGLAFIRKRPRTKYVIRMNGGHHFFSAYENKKLDVWKTFQEKRSFSKADSIVGVSKFVIEETSKYIKFNPNDVPVLFNPIDTKKFQQGLVDNVVPGRIIFFGTVCEKKGIRQLVQAMPLIKSEVPNAHLLIVGREWYFPKTMVSYNNYLKSFFYGMEDSIKIVGAVPNDELPKLIETANVCVLPSHMEAMPLAWLEALAMGMPFVGSNVGPGREVVIDGMNGLTCNPHLPSDIASKVIFMLKNKAEAMQMGAKARIDVMQRFDINVLLNQNIKFYKSVVER